MKLNFSKWMLILLLIAGAGVGGVYLYQHRGEETTDDANIAGRSVSISPKIAGYVKTLAINDNQLVKAGDVLLEIDDTDYVIRRDKAKATYEAARAAALASLNILETTTVSAPSNRDAAQAQVESAKANWDKANKDLQRMQHLSDQARSQGQLDQAIAAEKSTKAAYYEAQARLRTADTAPKAIASARATTNQLDAQYRQAQADLAQAENDLANTKLRAAIDGRITNRGVERGNYVQVGEQLASLVSTEVWVIANFKETQLEHMHPGQAVSIRVDAYPDKDFAAKLDSIQAGTGAFFSAFPPQNATGNFVKIVQRVPVKIVFEQLPTTDVVLGPGMSVLPTVFTRSE
jgi:membrane fusion protein (multidrug efflux system)